MATVTLDANIIHVDSPRISLRASDCPTQASDGHLTVTVEKVDRLRERMICNVSTQIQIRQGTIEHAFDIPNHPLELGIYIITSVEIRTTDGTIQLLDHSKRFEEKIFFKVVTDLAEGDPTAPDIQTIIVNRERSILMPMVTARAECGIRRSFRVSVFCASTLIYGIQHLEGYSIYPMREAMTYEGLRLAVNQFVGPAFGISIGRDQNLSIVFSQNNPAFVIVYHNVVAPDFDDAIHFAREHAFKLNIVIGIERGQRPTDFAVVADDGTEIHHGFNYPGYRGNFAASFDFGDVAEQIERTLPRIQKSAWARLLASNYAQATAEVDFGFQYLRYWSLIEQIAKKQVTSDSSNILRPDGTTILNTKSKPVLTKGAAAKVYSYLMHHGIYQTNIGTAQGHTLIFEGNNSASPKSGDEVIPLWELLGAAYKVRNAVAHTGEFIPDPSAPPGTPFALASRFFLESGLPLFRHLRDAAQRALFRELATI